MLTLPIKRKWFDMIAAGEKTEEYRALTPYYAARFRNISKFYCNGKLQAYVILRAGYSKSAPRLCIRCWIDIGEGHEDWGAAPGEIYYRLHITWMQSVKLEVKT